jgi:hypothetical protein
MAAEIIGEVVSPKGKIFKVKWDSDSKEIFMAIENEWSKIGEDESADEAMKRAEGMVKHLAKGRYPIFDDRPTPLSWIELPKGFGDFSNLEEEADGLPAVPMDTALAIQEILENNMLNTEKSEMNDDTLKKKNTSEVHYSESFIAQGLKVLWEMAEKNISQIPYGEPFNFLVVIGETDKPIIAVLDVPEALKIKIGDKAYIVRE